ncbi:MAG: sulfatase-like hydrolase/transferase, partial [Verrucomicrobia bacterium]|nr:sulfatase-like hydrolase/transferase [Verrucomicrobiota bacterium]
FIDKYKEDPFFLYVAYNAPHVPFQATDEAIARNDHIENEKRRTYAGMITALDDSIGRILEKLRALDLEENTMILFISDNGSPTGAKMTLGYVDGNNDPLRGNKGTLYEGGIRVPFIVQWKGGGLPEGTTYNRPVSSLDVLPTALGLAGVTSSSELPGLNILPYLKGNKPDKDPVDALYWRYKGYRAVRAGDWKWVSDPKSKVTGLFNLAEDLSEQKNLKKENPKKAEELEALWRKWNKKNAAPLWQPTSLEKMRKAYGNEGMKLIE